MKTDRRLYHLLPKKVCVLYLEQKPQNKISLQLLTKLRGFTTP